MEREVGVYLPQPGVVGRVVVAAVAIVVVEVGGVVARDVAGRWVTLQGIEVVTGGVVVMMVMVFSNVDCVGMVLVVVVMVVFGNGDCGDIVVLLVLVCFFMAWGWCVWSCGSGEVKVVIVVARR